MRPLLLSVAAAAASRALHAVSSRLRRAHEPGWNIPTTMGAGARLLARSGWEWVSEGGGVVWAGCGFSEWEAAWLSVFVITYFL